MEGKKMVAKSYQWKTEYAHLALKIRRLVALGTWSSPVHHACARCLLLGRKVLSNLDSILKSRDITLPTNVHLVIANKCPSSQGYGLSSSHVWMWELNCKEIWVLKNWCFWTVVLEKTLESPLDSKEIQPVYEISPEYSLEGVMLISWNSKSLATWCKGLSH